MRLWRRGCPALKDVALLTYSLATIISTARYRSRGRVRWIRSRSMSATPGTIRCSSTVMDYSIRHASLADREAIQRLIAQSARGLSRAYYDDTQIEAAIATVFGVDTDLIEDGTYFVADSAGELIGCGGWSRRRTLFGGDQYASRDASYLGPLSGPAKIGGFFITSGS